MKFLSEYVNIKVKHVLLALSCLALINVYIIRYNYNLLPVWTYILESNYRESLKDQEFPNVVDIKPFYSKAFDSPKLLITLNYPLSNETEIGLFTFPSGEEILQVVEFKDESHVHHLSETNRQIFTNQTVVSVNFFNHRNETYFFIHFNVNNNKSFVRLFNSNLNVLWERTLKTNNTSSKIVFNHLFLGSMMYFIEDCDIIRVNACGFILFAYKEYTDNSNSSDFDWNYLSYSLNGTEYWGENKKKSDQNKASNIKFDNWKVKLMENYTMDYRDHLLPWLHYHETILSSFVCLFIILCLQPFRTYSVEDVQIKLIPCVKQSDLVHLSSMDFLRVVKKRPKCMALIHQHHMEVVDLINGRLLSKVKLNTKTGVTYAALPISTETKYSRRSSRGDITGLHLHSLSVVSRISRTSGLLYQSAVFEEDFDEDNPLHIDPEDSRITEFSHTIDCIGMAHLHEDELTNTKIKRRTFAAPGLCRPIDFFEYPRFGKPEWQEDSHKVVPPLVLSSDSMSARMCNILKSDAKSQPFQGLYRMPCAHNTSGLSYANDIYFITSDGLVSCFDQNGLEKWRVASEVSWIQRSRAAYVEKSNDDDLKKVSFLHITSDVHDVYVNRFRPSMEAINIIPFVANPFMNIALGQSFEGAGAPVEGLVAIGWDSLSVIDRANGYRLATHSLPDQPIAPARPVVIPMPSDRHTFRFGAHEVPTVTYFIVICEGTVTAFALTASMGVSKLVVTSLAVLVVSAFLVFCLESLYQEEEEQRKPPPRRPATNVQSFARQSNLTKRRLPNSLSDSSDDYLPLDDFKYGYVY